MIEIIFNWRLAVYIGNIAEQKGLNKTSYQVMAIILSLSGEVLWFIFGPLLFGGEGMFLLRYMMALTGAVMGAWVGFLVMRLIPKNNT